MNSLRLLLGATLTLLAVPASAQTLVGITNQNWQYFAVAGDNPGFGWEGVGFDDSIWLTGRGLFGQDTGYPYPFVSTFSGPGSNGPLVAFFRTTFGWSGSTTGVVFTMTNYFDDGVVIYLNGTELTRFNMPAGVADQNTFAPGSLSEPVLRVHQFALSSLTNGNPNPLVAGTNLLAASVHNTQFSSDAVFGLSVFASPAVAPCTDNAQPTNRVVLEGRTTTFTVAQPAGCGIPFPTLQWYRDVGLGAQLITGQIGASLTVTNARRSADEGQYYCRLVNSAGSEDSRHAVLTVQHDDAFPQFLRFRADSALNVFHLVVDEPLCMDTGTCGSDAASPFNWRIVNIDKPANDLGVASVTLNGTNVAFTTMVDHTFGELYKLVGSSGSGIADVFGNFVSEGYSITNEPEPTAISVGPTGSKLYTFDDEPPYVREFSSFVWPGASGGTAETIAVIDAKVQLLDTANINQALIGMAGTPPSAFVGPARWASAGGYLITRPAGTAGNVILARVRNDSGVARPATIVSYDLTVELPTTEEAPGHLVYFSLSGAAGSWSPVPGISGDGSTGSKVIPLDLSATVWTAGSFLYLLWVDDNGSGSPDSALEIDNFRLAFPCPGIPVSIISNATSVITNEGATAHFTIVAAGPPPLTYQWLKDGLLLSNGSNVSGTTTAQLTIADANLNDEGSYVCRVSNEGCFTIADSAPATLTIVKSTRPSLANAVSTDSNTVTLTFSKPMSTSSAQATGNYAFAPAVGISSAMLSVDGRTVTLTTAARTFPNKYRLTITGLSDSRASANLLNPNPTVVDLTSSIIVGTYGDTWRYETNNLDGQTWTLPGYNDSGWRVGGAFFGFEPTPAITNSLPAPHLVTFIPPNNATANPNAFVTSYFRRQITLPTLGPDTTYQISHFTDDGAIFYLDGVEINRYQMPAGAPTFVTRSSGGNDEAVVATFLFTASAGVHTLAVEVHQAGVTNSDIVFGANISAVTLPTALSISRGNNGTSAVSWSADGAWQLIGSQNAQGSYAPVASDPFGLFNIAPNTTTNHFFYQLRHRGQ